MPPAAERLLRPQSRETEEGFEEDHAGDQQRGIHHHHPSTLGTIWRSTMLAVETPPTCAASINSLRFRLSVCPRTIRAISSGHHADGDKDQQDILTKKVTSRMTKNINGRS